MNLNSINRTVSMLGQMFDPRRSTTPMVEMPSDKPAFREEPIHQPFPRVTPEAAGVSSTHVEAFVRELTEEHSLYMHNLMILRGGKVIFETSFGGQDIHVWKYTFSACKSIVSLAVGMLIDEEKLRLDDRIVDMFPDYVTRVNRLLMKDITVRHLLTMSSTVTFNEAETVTQEDWIKAFFNSVTVGELGKTFQYNSLNTYMLAAIVCRVSGESLSSYLDRKLFKPLGITQYHWETCPGGIEKGGWGLYIRPEDMAKVGQMVMQKGRWKRRRIVSREWIEQATKAYMTAPDNYGDFNYSYQIWVGRKSDAFLFNGMFGQNVLGFRNNGILVLSNAGNDEMFQQSSYFEKVQRYFGEEFGQALPEDEEAYESLRNLQFAVSEKLPLPEECEWLCGMRLYPTDDLALAVGLAPVTWQAVQGRFTEGLEGLEFSVEEGRLMLHYTESGQTWDLPVGFGRGEVSEARLGDIPFRVSTLGKFSTDEDDHPVFQVRIDFLETPCSRKLKLYFMDKTKVLLKQEEQPGVEYLKLMMSVLLENAEKRKVIAAAVNKIDRDYLVFKVERMLMPEIWLRAEES